MSKARARCSTFLPTGGGKTIVFAHVIDGAARKGRRVGVLVHRRELVRQAADKLAWAGVPHGIVAAGLDRDHDAPVLVMSVQTAARRLDRLPKLDFIVADESHHARLASWARVLAHWPRAKVLGVTATPAQARRERARDRRRRVFDHLTIGATVRRTAGRRVPGAIAGVRPGAADRHRAACIAAAEISSPANWPSGRAWSPATRCANIGRAPIISRRSPTAARSPTRNRSPPPSAPPAIAPRACTAACRRRSATR